MASYLDIGPLQSGAGLDIGALQSQSSTLQTVDPTAIASQQSLGTPYIVVPGIGPTAIASRQALGTPSIGGGTVTVDPAFIPSPRAIGSPSLVGPIYPTVHSFPPATWHAVSRRRADRRPHVHRFHVKASARRWLTLSLSVAPTVHRDSSGTGNAQHHRRAESVAYDRQSHTTADGHSQHDWRLYRTLRLRRWCAVAGTRSPTRRLR